MATKVLDDKLTPLMVRLPPDLHAALRQVAAAERRSLNMQILVMLEEGLEARHVAKRHD